MATLTETHSIKVNRFEIVIRPNEMDGIVIEHHRLDGRTWTWSRDSKTGKVTFESGLYQSNWKPPQYVCAALYRWLCEGTIGGTYA